MIVVVVVAVFDTVVTVGSMKLTVFRHIFKSEMNRSRKKERERER